LFWVVIALRASVSALSGCNSASSSKKSEAPDPKAFTDAQFERMKNGFSSINVGQMLMQRTRPTGSYIPANPPQMTLSADRRDIIGKVTVKWSGGVSKAQYQTDFTIEITKNRVRLTVERDTAVFQIEPNQLRLAELDLTNIVRLLY
jgi:hypothetical protein